jgi:hypothetical protein
MLPDRRANLGFHARTNSRNSMPGNPGGEGPTTTRGEGMAPAVVSCPPCGSGELLLGHFEDGEIIRKWPCLGCHFTGPDVAVIMSPVRPRGQRTRND